MLHQTNNIKNEAAGWLWDERQLQEKLEKARLAFDVLRS